MVSSMNFCYENMSMASNFQDLKKPIFSLMKFIKDHRPVAQLVETQDATLRPRQPQILIMVGLWLSLNVLSFKLV